tara:strand:- start:851 stop:2323 length:1473 start_codon:yes stop_codon:yes gene_type:complete
MYVTPKKKEILNLAKSMDWNITGNQAADLENYLSVFQDGYKWLDGLQGLLPKSRFSERSFQKPEPNENPFNAWYVKTSIETNKLGSLKGKKVAVKDNIFVQDVPLSNGSRVLENFKADYDAPVVERILEAGGDIIGKTNCEYFCLSGGSATSYFGTVDNPRKKNFSTGGSSSGSAALVAAGVVDIALGTDQGGSVRSPASWTGTVGMKATRGLVPYDGAIVMENSIDYIGPITRTAAENAEILRIIADPVERSFTSKIGGNCEHLRVALLQEGFDHPSSEPQVDQVVRNAGNLLQKKGVTVDSISVPSHLLGGYAWGAIVSDGFWQSLKLSGNGYNHSRSYSVDLYDGLSSWSDDLDLMPVNAQTLILLGYSLEKYRGYYYGKAKNYARLLGRAYDEALKNYDALLLPTTVQRASMNPDPDDHQEIFRQAFSNTINTAQFNASGHPALSIPCGLRDDLPVGMMLVGRHNEEHTLYQLAVEFESNFDWQAL